MACPSQEHRLGEHLGWRSTVHRRRSVVDVATATLARPVIVRARRAGCGRRRRPAGLSVSMLLTSFHDGWLRAIIESESPSILGTGSNPALIARPNRERHMPATSQSTRQPRVLVV